MLEKAVRKVHWLGWISIAALAAGCTAPGSEDLGQANSAANYQLQLGRCDDTPPPGSSYTCTQQAGWGKCTETWMQGFCDKSCNRCSGAQYEPASALHEAASVWDLQKIKYLIETKHMDPNARNADGLTPLHVAFESLGREFSHPAKPEMARVAEYLLSKGADPSIPFSYGPEPAYTLLHFAAYDGNMVLVPMLVNAGAKVNARDSRNFTPLHSAARCDFRLSCDDCTVAGRDDFYTRWKQGAKPVIKYLLEHGADITARTKTGQSVLDIFLTPCGYKPELCDPQTIESAEWPTGTCKAAYLFVKGKLEEAR